MSRQVTLFRYQSRRKRSRESNRLEWRGMLRDEIQWNNQITQVLVEDGVTRIEDGAFRSTSDVDPERKYDSLERVTMAKTVEHIGSAAFEACANLVEVDIADDALLVSIGRDAFCDCSSLKQITLPSSLRTIGILAFRATNSLTAVTFPSSLESIRSACFALSGLTKLDLTQCPLLTVIEGSTFSSCYSLTMALLPPNLQRIEHCAFRKTSLEAITFPKAVQFIYGAKSGPVPAFHECTKLKTVRITSMRTLTRALIRYPPFGSILHGFCKSLHTVELPDSATFSKGFWSRAIHDLFLNNGGILGRDSSQKQRSSCVYAFLQSRMQELLE